MITATEVGRNLHILVEGVTEPFVISPLPGRVGRQITDTYIRGAMGAATAQEVEDALRIALDGAVLDEATGTYVPLPRDEQHNWNRIDSELRTSEGESVANPALYWQTVVGIAGVNAYIQGGEGIAGLGKALEALVARTGLSALTTSPDSALETLIQSQVSTRSTSSLPAGRKPGKPLLDRLPKRKKQ